MVLMRLFLIVKPDNHIALDEDQETEVRGIGTLIGYDEVGNDTERCSHRIRTSLDRWWTKNEVKELVRV